jgi:excisionase family DNA binding protein
MNDIKVYDLNEVSNILKVTRRTVYNYISNGQLRAVKMGKYWRVSREALKNFLEQGTTADYNPKKLA